MHGLSLANGEEIEDHPGEEVDEREHADQVQTITTSMHYQSFKMTQKVTTYTVDMNMSVGQLSKHVEESNMDFKENVIK